MRYRTGQHGIGGRDESWFYVEFDVESGKAFWVHEWHNLNHRLHTDEGERRVEIEKAKGESFYSEAIAVLKEKHPEWAGFKGE